MFIQIKGNFRAGTLPLGGDELPESVKRQVIHFLNHCDELWVVGSPLVPQFCQLLDLAASLGKTGRYINDLAAYDTLPADKQVFVVLEPETTVVLGFFHALGLYKGRAREKGSILPFKPADQSFLLVERALNFAIPTPEQSIRKHMEKFAAMLRDLSELLDPSVRTRKPSRIKWDYKTARKRGMTVINAAASMISQSTTLVDVYDFSRVQYPVPLQEISRRGRKVPYRVYIFGSLAVVESRQPDLYFPATFQPFVVGERQTSNRIVIKTVDVPVFLERLHASSVRTA